jgi:hypothetical protein
MLQLLAADAAENGAAVIAQVRKEKPHVWLQCMCALLPRQVSIEKLSPLGELTDEELRLCDELLTATHARTVRELERHNGAASFPPASPDSTDSK